MVKSKQPNFVAANTKRKKSSVDDAEASLLGEDDWVLVKKQMVNIIIPPSAVSEEVDTEPHIVVSDIQADPKVIAHQQMHSPCEKERSDSSIPKTTGVNDSGICPQPNPACLNESVLEDRFVLQNPYIERCRDHRIIGVCNSRVIKRLAVSADRNAVLHQRIRTLMIEKRLKQVGGLSKWLVSLGLDRFIKIFLCNGVDKYQLACLTMGELKEMGALTVGPRRKLLHAIDRLCQPYCYK